LKRRGKGELETKNLRGFGLKKSGGWGVEARSQGFESALGKNVGETFAERSKKPAGDEPWICKRVLKIKKESIQTAQQGKPKKDGGNTQKKGRKNASKPKKPKNSCR